MLGREPGDMDNGEHGDTRITLVQLCQLNKLICVYLLCACMHFQSWLTRSFLQSNTVNGRSSLIKVHAEGVDHPIITIWIKGLGEVLFRRFLKSI